MHELGYGPVVPPTQVRGTPAPVRAGQVGVVNADGTVDVNMATSRGSRSRVEVVDGLTLAVGDRVIVVDVDGDPQTPIVMFKRR